MNKCTPAVVSIVHAGVRLVLMSIPDRETVFLAQVAFVALALMRDPFLFSSYASCLLLGESHHLYRIPQPSHPQAWLAAPPEAVLGEVKAPWD